MTTDSSPSGARLAQLSWWGLLAGLFLLIFGARLWLIHDFGVCMPYFDEWTVEGKLFKACLEHQLSLGLFFRNLNEHWIVFTRVFLLGLFCANGQWDPAFFTVAQAPFNALDIVILAAALGKLMGAHSRAALVVVAAAFGMIPFGWQNALMGCEIHFYLFPLLGVLTTWYCWRYEPLSPRWWLGAMFAFANLFTMASGIFSTAAVAGFLILGMFQEPARRRRLDIGGTCILSAIIAGGLVFILIQSRKLDQTRPHFAEIVSALTHLLSWPCSLPWAWCIVQAPFILLVILVLVQRVPLSDSRWFPILIGAAYWLQIIATAARRASVWDNSRYRDSWILLSITLAACLYFLGKSMGGRRLLFLGFVIVWSFIMALGVLNNVFTLLPREIVSDYARRLTMENNVRGYLRTGDATWLNGDIPADRRETLLIYLDSPEIRNVLPPGTYYPNPPLRPLNEEKFGGGLASNGYPAGMPDLGMPVYGSYDKDKLLNKSGVALRFAVPKGTHQVEIQVAGSPAARSFELKLKEGHTYRNISAPVNPGLGWETLSIDLDPRTTLFGLNATHWPAYAWAAFSAPSISTRPPLARWSQAATSCYAAVLALGLALMLGAVAESIFRYENPPRPRATE